MKTSIHATKYFLSKGYERGICLTKKKLQKLVYYSQAWHLVFLGKPLFDDEFQAWRHGAVSIQVRQAYREYQYDSLPTPVENIDWEPNEAKILEEIWRVYGFLSADELEDLNHHEMPWLNARVGLAPNESSKNPISQYDMKFYYSHFVADKENYKISNNAVDKDKKIQVELEFTDGTTCKIDREEAEEFIISNLGKFKKKRFKPRGRRRTCA
ncbi:putative phage-associated protein [Xenococcus sp. PCC 7305]|uniref:Panacea domain-containing protein n=1 Tax=Xenococcus sp. PCC 7305 TaxID=102125 RepID=UPI0002ABA8F7|nr:type II toxin-antitoxin system antitoxin SocA domain-containing protein [Xenococcus sp. PCC 7305]ELS03573.1 putative phage-associated protein [Xenococcus sp. PCC 7305]